jgi:cyclophilin family peptidyl-prolyl cis-trans isomerase
MMKKDQMRTYSPAIFASTLMAAVAVLLMSASGCESPKGGDAAQFAEPARVQIDTKFGSMVVQLSDSTPQHRDNFLKLVDEQFYDSLVFHRVIREFMVQGGDPQSKGADPNARLGSGGPGYTVEAEIRPDLLHVKGALAAARQGDNVNPERRSSGSQFYLVQGRQFSENELSGIEGRIASFAQEYGNGLANVENGQFVYSEEAREAYKTLGGTPFLDMQYTVFGYVVEGLDIVDSIAEVPTDRRRGDRPVEDVVMSMKRLN